MVKTASLINNQFVTYIDPNGVQHRRQPDLGDLSGFNLLGLVTLPSPGTSITLSGSNGMAVCTGTCTVTIPAPVSPFGQVFCAMNDNNVTTAITFAALGSSAMYQNTAGTAYGTAGTGTLVSGTGTAGTMLCMIARDATHYLTTSFRNAWTAN